VKYLFTDGINIYITKQKGGESFCKV